MSNYYSLSELEDIASRSEIVRTLRREHDLYPETVLVDRQARNRAIVSFHYSEDKTVKVGTYFSTPVVSRDMQTGDLVIDCGGYSGSPTTHGHIYTYLAKFKSGLSWRCNSASRGIQLLSENSRVDRVLNPDVVCQEPWRDKLQDWRHRGIPRDTAIVNRSVVYQENTIVREGHIPADALLFDDQVVVMRAIANLIRQMDTLKFRRATLKKQQHCSECWKHYATGTMVSRDHLWEHISDKQPSVTLILAALSSLKSSDLPRSTSSVEGIEWLTPEHLQITQAYLAWICGIDSEVKDGYGRHVYKNVPNQYYLTIPSYSIFREDMNVIPKS